MRCVSADRIYHRVIFTSMKHILPIIIVLTIFRSGLLAQSSPNGFDMMFDKKAKEVSIVTCAENGFCVVTESKSRKMHQLAFVHADTNMRQVWDTVLDVPHDLQVTRAFHEDGTLVVLGRHFQGTRITDRMTVFLYLIAAHQFETREIQALPMDASLANWHYHQGNLLFSTKAKLSDCVWFLPAGINEPFPFTFTRENPGRVLSLDVDTANGRAVLVFASGIRTMYFETDFHGKSSFANIIGEPATQAQWVPVNRNHSLLMLYFHDDENFEMHPVNILNHKVMPSDTIFCADIDVPKIDPFGTKAKKMIIVTPFSYVSFYPTYAGCTGDEIYCVTELYVPEYSNYFNGWYVEPRFNGYRYERADVHFFDTNGVFLTNVIFPYDEESSLHSHIIKKLKIFPLQNNDILLYYQNAQEQTSMLIDSAFKTKDPVRTTALPLPKIAFKKQRFAVDRFEPWYGDNQFMLTAFRVNVMSQRKVGYMVRKLEYN